MLRALVILLLASAPLHAQGSLADIVPPSTSVLIEYDDLGGHEQWTKNAALGRIWAEPEVQQFVQGMKKAIAKGIANQRAQGPDFFMMAGLEPTDFLGIEIRRAGVALCGMEQGHPDVLVMVELRKGATKVAKILRQFRMACNMFLGAVWQEEEGSGIWHMTMGDYEYAHVVAGDRVLISTGRPRIKQTLALLKGAKMARLSGEKTYRATFAAMDATRTNARFYVNAPVLWRQVMPFMNRRELNDARQAIEVMGLGAVEAFAAADIPVGANLRTEFCIKLKERKGFFGLFQAAPTTHRFAGQTPRNPLLYGSERYDLARGLRDLVAWIEKFEPQAGQEYRSLLDRYNRVMGIDIEKDFIGSLGDEWTAYVGDTPGGSLIPDMVLMVSLKDRARFEKAVRAMVESYPDVLEMYGVKRATSVRHRRTQFQGKDIHLLELADRRGEPIPVVPCWTFGEDHVSFALWPHALKHHLTKRPSFDGNEGFRKVLEHAPAGAVSQGYFDLPRVVGFLYNTLVPIVQGVQGAADKELERFGTALNFHDLPRAEVITRHLTPCVSYTKVQDDAIRMGYVSPCGLAIGIGSIAAVGGAVGGAVLAIERGREREMARRRMEARAAAKEARARLDMVQEQLNQAQRVNQQLARQLELERKRWAQRLEKLEAQLAELKKLIEDER